MSTRLRPLDKLYAAGGILAAILLVLIALFTLAQVLGSRAKVHLLLGQSRA